MSAYPRFVSRIELCLLAGLLALLVTACGAAPEEAIPTPTPVPRSLVMLVPPVAGADAAEAAAFEALEQTILDRTGIGVDIRPAESDAEALRILCSGELDGLPVTAWVGGLSFAAAQANACGRPFVQIARSEAAQDRLLTAQISAPVDVEPTDEPDLMVEADETSEGAESTAETGTPEPTPEAEAAEGEAETPTPEPTAEDEADTETETDEPVETGSDTLVTGLPGLIIVDPALATTDLSAINERVFCRLSVDDVYSWVLPVMAMRAAGIDLFTAPSEVVDIATIPELVEAVAEGDCAMAGVPQGTLPMIEGAGDTVRIAETTVPLPFGVLFYPLDVTEVTRLSINNLLIELANDAASVDLLRPLLAQNALLPAASEDFDTLQTFIDRTGIDFAELDE